MMQLREGGSRNHIANFSECRVVANTVRLLGNAEPDAAAGSFDRARQGAIVNDLAANARDATNAFEGRRADKDAAAGGSRGFAIATGHPRGRIKHEKEEDEGRNQQRFGQRTAAQLDHQRNKIESACFGASYQFGDIAGRVNDVGVSEEKIVRHDRLGMPQTF